MEKKRKKKRSFKREIKNSSVKGEDKNFLKICFVVKLKNVYNF